MAERRAFLIDLFERLAEERNKILIGTNLGLPGKRQSLIKSSILAEVGHGTDYIYHGNFQDHIHYHPAGQDQEQFPFPGIPC